MAPAAVAVLPLAALPQLASRIPAADGEVVVAARFPGPAAAVERALERAAWPRARPAATVSRAYMARPKPPSGPPSRISRRWSTGQRMKRY